MRSMVLRTIRLVAVLLLSALAAAQQPWVPIGPDGGDVRTLTQDPHAPNRILLTTSAGMIFESQNGGASWTRLARVDDRDDYVIDALIFHPTRPGVVYAAAWSVEDNRSGDVLKSIDGGVTWKRSREMHGESVRALAMSASNPDVLVAGTLNGVFRTTNGGVRWSLISPPDHADIRNVESVAIDPKDPDVVYAGTWHLPWKTTDGGLTWKNIKQGVIDDSDVFSIIIDPLATHNVYMSACSGIYKSENAGDLFRKAQGIPSSSRRTRVLIQDPQRAEVVYAGTTEGLWRSVDAGVSWTRLTGSNIIINDILIDPVDTRKIMLATDRGGVLVSSDSGGNFTPSNRGFSHRQVATLLVDSRDRDTIYAGVINDKEFGGVFVSRDGGNQWQQMSAGLEGADVYALRQNAAGDIVAGTNRGVFAFTGAATDYRWHALRANDSAGVTDKGKARKTVKLAVMTFRVNDLDITMDLWLAAGSSGIFTSTDTGKTWIGGSKEGLTDFIAVRRIGNSVIAAARRGVIASHDGGLTWKRGNVPAYTITDAALDESGNMYFAAREGLFRSIDGGVNWELMKRFPVNNVNSIIWDHERQRLFATSSNAERMFESSDAGDHWRGVDVGWTLKSLRVAGDRVFAATQFDGIVVPSTGERASGAVAAGGSQD